MGKKILVLGVGQNNFLSFLYSKLKTVNNSYTITAPFFKDLNKDVKYDSWMYDNATIKRNINIIDYAKSLIYILTSKHFYQTVFFIFFVEKKIKKAAHFFLKSLKEKAFFYVNNNFNEFDTFHFHYMQYSYLREVFLVPKNKNIVCTFWGSDLLRTTDILNFYFVKKALNRATFITCQSLELREIILSKFGRNLSNKTKVAIFPLEEKIFKELDDNFKNNEELISFKKKYSFSSEKYNVLVGHNGNPFNNHLDIIMALYSLKTNEKIHIIVNLNYALNPGERENYKKKIIKLLDESEIEYTILEKFYTLEELPFSRFASDIFIHMPSSDALSNTVIEMLYAKNLVITGSWLPYKTFTKNDLVYYEVDDYSQLSAKLDAVISNYENEKIRVFNNSKIIKENFLGNNFITNWLEIL